MKKILFLGLAALITFSATAQKSQPAPLLKERAKTYLDQDVQVQQTGPVKQLTLTDAKSITRIPFGSSFNLLTLLASEENNCDYNADLDLIMFSHRAGGTYGGSSGDIRCHYTPFNGATAIDSVEFIHQGTDLMRYPGGVIYNPAGNTNPANAMAIITGPCTGGSGWTKNYFCSQKLDGSSIKYHMEAVNGVYKPFYVNLTACDGGQIKVCGINTDEAGTFYFRKGQVEADSVNWLSPVYEFTNSYEVRHFSNDTTPWAFAPNMAFSQDGQTGYFYVMGWEAADDGINSGPKPIVWKTVDGGTSWNKLPVLDLSTLNTKLSSFIWPTRATMYGDPALYVYRPGIMCGATVEETNFPGVVDMNGNLHIGVNIEGMYSNDIDSLTYTYAYHPWSIADLHTTSTGWDVDLIDTINAGIDKGVILSDQNLDHCFHAATTEDASKILFMWTDTELDTSNYMPDIHANMFYASNNQVGTAQTLTSQQDYYFFNAAHRIVDNGNDTYCIPATFAAINGNTTDAEAIHNFIKGLCYSPVGIKENENIVSINNVSVTPNPANDFVNVDFKLDKPVNVKVSVYNLLGKEVMNKDCGKQTSGESRVTLNTSNFSSGIYFMTLQAENEKVTKKVVIK